MSGFGLASIKEAGSKAQFDSGFDGDDKDVIASTWFEFIIEDTRIQEVVDHLKLIGVDYDPRIGS